MSNGYNSYLGIARTPPPLNWLLSKRSEVLGEIKAIEKVVATAPDRLAKLRGQLATLDATIAMQDIPVDLAEIPARRSRPTTQIKLPYGSLPRLIYRCLREAGNKPLLTGAFLQAAFTEHGVPMSSENYKALRRIVVMGLNGLVKRGTLLAIVPEGSHAERSWCLTSAGELEVSRSVDPLKVSNPPTRSA